MIATDAVANTVTVGTREDIETRRIRVRDAVLHRDGARVDNVRLRYHSATLPGHASAPPPRAATRRSSCSSPSPSTPPPRARPRC